MLKYKFVSDYDVVLKYLNEQYGLSIVDYKLYHPNLVRNDIFIKNHQKINVILMLENQKNMEEKKRNDWSYEDTKVINKWEYNDSYVISLSYIIIYENLMWIIKY